MQNVIKMKEEDPEFTIPTTENFGEFKCISCDQIYGNEADYQTHKLSHFIPDSSKDARNISNSMKGIKEVSELSDEEDYVSETNSRNESNTENSTDNQVKNNSEEKNSPDDENMMDESSDTSIHSNDSLSVDLNIKELLTKDFVRDKNLTAGLSDGDNLGNEISHSDHSIQEDEENQIEGDDAFYEKGSGERKSTLTLSNENEILLSEDDEPANESGCFAEKTNSEMDDKSARGSNDENLVMSEEPENDSSEKNNDVEVIEVKRPSSRESTASNASGSSERTLTIRSASQVNQMVVDSCNLEKPSLSVLNPSQLGAVKNTNVENLLQSRYSNNDHSRMNNNGDSQFLAEFRNQQPGQSPVQQLAHQVQSIPVRFNMDPLAYSTQPIIRNVPPVYLASPSNVQGRQFNLNNVPRLGTVRTVLPNSVAAANQQKRTMPSQLPPPSLLSSQSKRRCNNDNNYIVRNGDTSGKGVSVPTDDVVAQLSKSITLTARQESQKKNEETAAVANLLANRGITVSSVPTKSNKSSNPVAMLNLNSAVSLIPTSNTNNQNRQNSGFAVPRMANNRLPTPGQISQTVDLTGPDPPRIRPAGRQLKNTCQICDRAFLSQELLNKHMSMHKGQRKSQQQPQLPFKCSLCNAQYPTQQGLIVHRQTCQRNANTVNNEMVIPIVDLKQPGAMQKLQSIGINHMIPLNALGAQAANGTFGIPILPFSSGRNTVANMASIGISNILPVGPLRTLGR